MLGGQAMESPGTVARGGREGGRRKKDEERRTKERKTRKGKRGKGRTRKREANLITRSVSPTYSYK